MQESPADNTMVSEDNPRNIHPLRALHLFRISGRPVLPPRLTSFHTPDRPYPLRRDVPLCRADIEPDIADLTNTPIHNLLSKSFFMQFAKPQIQRRISSLFIVILYHILYQITIAHNNNALSCPGNRSIEQVTVQQHSRPAKQR